MPIIVCDCAKKLKEDPGISAPIRFQEKTLGKNRRYANVSNKNKDPQYRCTICGSVTNKAVTL